MTMINLKALKAVSAFASTEDTRYYLNGVFVEVTPDQALYVATDGHRLVVIREKTETDWTGEIIVPTETCRAFKFGKRDETNGRVLATLSPADDGKFILKQIYAQGAYFSPIDGTFPDWRRVVPLSFSGAPGQFNAEYLAAFHKFGKIMGFGMPTVTHNGDDAAMINFPNDPNEAFGILMPYRAPKPAEHAPAWVRPIQQKEVA